jgi:hypothetical protein
MRAGKITDDYNVWAGVRVWTSWMKRTIETAAAIQAPQVYFLKFLLTI